MFSSATTFHCGKYYHSKCSVLTPNTPERIAYFQKLIFSSSLNRVCLTVWVFNWISFQSWYLFLQTLNMPYFINNTVSGCPPCSVSFYDITWSFLTASLQKFQICKRNLPARVNWGHSDAKLAEESNIKTCFPYRSKRKKKEK